MMVYVVMECIDDEYGCRSAHSVYASKADAEAWVAEHQEMLDPWFCEEKTFFYFSSSNIRSRWPGPIRARGNARARV